MHSSSHFQSFSTISLIFNSLSLLGCLKSFYSYSKASQLSGPQITMLSFIIIADFFLATSGFLNCLIGPDDGFYKINISFTLISLWSSAFWTSAMAYLSYKRISSRSHKSDFGKLHRFIFKIWLILCVAVPLVLILVVFSIFGISFTPTANRFDSEAGRTESLTLFLLLEVIPFVSSIAVTFYWSYRQMKTLYEFELFHISGKNILRLLRYPIGQSLIFLPCIICKSLFFINPQLVGFWDAIRLFGYYLSGAINCLTYGNLMVNAEGKKGEILDPKMFPSMTSLTQENSNSDMSDYHSIGDDLDNSYTREFIEMKIDH